MISLEHTIEIKEQVISETAYIQPSYTQLSYSILGLEVDASVYFNYEEQQNFISVDINFCLFS